MAKSNKNRDISIIPAIIIIFSNVPKPGFCFKNIQVLRTRTLTIKVAKPTLQFNLSDSPSANTVQGLTPIVECIRSDSPKPKRLSPKHNKMNVFNLGLKLRGVSELQLVLGTLLMERNIKDNFIIILD